jgi:membrane associated rhomboid family serine protease
MTPTPVGMRCPECSRQKTKVRTAATITGDPQLTYLLIAINVIVYLAMASTGGGLNNVGGTVYQHGALYGPLVAQGDWWRIVTSGFLHAGLLHIAFNMYFLYFLGTMLEPMIGKLRFGAIYAISLLGGSFGALVLDPNVATVGASGAVFGLLGAGILALRARGISFMQSGLGVTLLLNLGITLLPGTNISIGAHVGGLASGLAIGFLMFDLAERRRLSMNPVLGVCAAVGVALVVGCLAVAKSAAGV